MRAAPIAIAGLLMIGLVALPPAFETLTDIEVPDLTTDAAAFVCHDGSPGGCCDSPIHEKLNIQC